MTITTRQMKIHYAIGEGRQDTHAKKIFSNLERLELFIRRGNRTIERTSLQVFDSKES